MVQAPPFHILEKILSGWLNEINDLTGDRTITQAETVVAVGDAKAC